jgi:hypothetical protein
LTTPKDRTAELKEVGDEMMRWLKAKVADKREQAAVIAYVSMRYFFDQAVDEAVRY